MTIVETMKSRWKPEYATRIAGGSHAFDTALSFIGAAGKKRSELAARGTLSEKGIADALREFADQGMVPALAKFREQVKTERANIAQRREHLAKPKIDPTDVAAAILRSEYRTYLRTLAPAEQIRQLIAGDDPAMVAAALEVPAGSLSGLAPEVRERVVQSHLERTAGDQLKAMAETEEALSVVEATVRLAEQDIASALRASAP